MDSTALTTGRSRPTKIIGERFYIYASKQWAAGAGRRADGSRQLAAKAQRPIVADNIVVPTEPLQPWMLELAEALRLWGPDVELPTGVIVGSAVIEKCEEVRDQKSEISGGTSDLPSDL